MAEAECPGGFRPVCNSNLVCLEDSQDCHLLRKWLCHLSVFLLSSALRDGCGAFPGDGRLVGAQDLWSTLGRGGMGGQDIFEGQALLRMASFIPSVFFSFFLPLEERLFFLKQIYAQKVTLPSYCFLAFISTWRWMRCFPGGWQVPEQSTCVGCLFLLFSIWDQRQW